MLNKYDLHLLEICETSLKLAEELVREWLEKYMFEGKKEKEELAKEISDHFLQHDDHKSHARPITISKAKEWKLDVEDMRENKDLRDKVWKLYCAIELFFDRSAAVKLYENAYGTSLMKNIPQSQVILQGPPPTGHPQPPQQKPQEK
jgi:hypothetical protein